jgi:hypothetical protein
MSLFRRDFLPAQGRGRAYFPVFLDFLQCSMHMPLQRSVIAA